MFDFTLKLRGYLWVEHPIFPLNEPYGLPERRWWVTGTGQFTGSRWDRILVLIKGNLETGCRRRCLLLSVAMKYTGFTWLSFVCEVCIIQLMTISNFNLFAKAATYKCFPRSRLQPYGPYWFSQPNWQQPTKFPSPKVLPRISISAMREIDWPYLQKRLIWKPFFWRWRTAPISKWKCRSPLLKRPPSIWKRSLSKKR